jgi:hypothetical protein
MSQQRITRDDLEAKFKALQDDVQHRVNDKKQSMTSAAVVGGVLLLVIVFFLGKRAGKKKTTYVELRRI